MGRLTREKNAESFLLNGRCLVGRAPTCHMLIEDERVSAEHAVIAYREGLWWIRDLSSTNGTFIDGNRIHQEAKLEAGASLTFGHTEFGFTFADAGPPAAEVIERKTGKSQLISPAGGIFPQGAVSDAAYLYQTNEGWIVETEGQAELVSEQVECTLGDKVFLIRPPLGNWVHLEETVALNVTHRPLTLRFRVSLDEEHVGVEVSYSGKEKDLGHRSYSYLLLTLARARRDEEETSTSPGEAGWLRAQELARALRVSPEQLNLWVWRARRHIEEVDGALPSMIVERRPHAGTLRLGTGCVTIEQA